MLDETSFTAFLTAHEGAIRTYVARLGVPWESVDEVAHEAFVQYYLGQNRRPKHVEPMRWLLSVARNSTMYWFRTRKSAHRWVELSEQCEPVAESFSLPGAGSSSAISALKICLQSLPEQSRNVLDWYYLNKLATEEIAERLQQTASAVRMQLMRMREALGGCIRRRMSAEAP